MSSVARSLLGWQRAVCLALTILFIHGCGTDDGDTNGTSGAAGSGPAPLAVLIVDGYIPDRRVIQSVSSIAPLEIASTVFTPGADDCMELCGRLALDAMDHGMLVLLSDMRMDYTAVPEGTELMRIDFAERGDSIPALSCHPASLADEFIERGNLLGTLADRQAALTEIYRKYLPELVVICLRTGSDRELLEAVAPWLSLTASDSLNLVLVTPHGSLDRRGWVALTGPDIRAMQDQPVGLEPSGLLATMRILLGLPWIGDRDWGTPAVSVIDPDMAVGGSTQGDRP